MKNKTYLLLAFIIAFSAAMIVSSCNKKFDEPPVPVTQLSQMGITATTNIATLKSMVGNADGAFRQIQDSVVITGVVSANDKSGNLYKELYIQDSSGGMSILIETSGLYNRFSVGQEIAVICKGLWLNNSKGMKKICQRSVVNGAVSSIGIAPADITKYLKTGAVNQPVSIKTVTIGQLLVNSTSLLGSLVRLEGVEVISSDTRKTWSDVSPAKVDQNIYIKGCSSNDQIIIRTSAYADFAGVKVPRGNGSVIGVFTTYNSTGQLLLRDLSDVKLDSTRCDGSSPDAADTLRTIQYIRSLGVGAIVPSHTMIEGVIASNSNNEAAGNFIIQDESGAALQMHFSSAKPYSLNDSLNIDISNATVGRFNNGALQLTNMGFVTTLGTGTIIPRVTTVADIMANYSTWESTVVRINNVTITPGTSNTTGTNYTITDAQGNSIPTFVRNALGLTLPASANSITGYIGIFAGTPQLTLREAADVK